MERSFGRPPVGALLAIPLALLIAVAPRAALAYPATWEFTGTVTGVQTEHGANWPSDITVGIPIRVLVSFDTDELLVKQNSRPDSSGNPRTGARYVAGPGFSAPPATSLQIAVYLGTSCAPCVPTNAAAAVQNNTIAVRCQFANDANAWTAGQTIATLTGKLANNETIVASDTIRLVP